MIGDTDINIVAEILLLIIDRELKMLRELVNMRTRS